MALELLVITPEGTIGTHNEKTDIWAFGMVIYVRDKMAIDKGDLVTFSLPGASHRARTILSTEERLAGVFCHSKRRITDTS